MGHSRHEVFPVGLGMGSVSDPLGCKGAEFAAWLLPYRSLSAPSRAKSLR